ncbi:MAG TPA: hypothetical protein PLR77_07975 [Caldisericia bacterium]|nr:hypothetical protein [Caldisericia bacterium]
MIRKAVSALIAFFVVLVPFSGVFALKDIQVSFSSGFSTTGYQKTTIEADIVTQFKLVQDNLGHSNTKLNVDVFPSYQSILAKQAKFIDSDTIRVVVTPDYLKKTGSTKPIFYEILSILYPNCLEQTKRILSFYFSSIYQKINLQSFASLCRIVFAEEEIPVSAEAKEISLQIMARAAARIQNIGQNESQARLLEFLQICVKDGIDKAITQLYGDNLRSFVRSAQLPLPPKTGREELVNLVKDYSEYSCMPPKNKVPGDQISLQSHMDEVNIAIFQIARGNTSELKATLGELSGELKVCKVRDMAWWILCLISVFVVIAFLMLLVRLSKEYGTQRHQKHETTKIIKTVEKMVDSTPAVSTNTEEKNIEHPEVKKRFRGKRVTRIGEESKFVGKKSKKRADNQ